MKKAPKIILIVSAMLIAILKSASIIDIPWWTVVLLMAAAVYFIAVGIATPSRDFRKSKSRDTQKVTFEYQHKSEFMKKLQEALSKHEELRNEFAEDKDNAFMQARKNELTAKHKSKFMQRLEDEMEKKNKKKNK